MHWDIKYLFLRYLPNIRHWKYRLWCISQYISSNIGKDRIESYKITKGMEFFINMF